MKYRFFALLLVTLVGTIKPMYNTTVYNTTTYDPTQFAANLAQIELVELQRQQYKPTEKDLRKRLYCVSADNPLFYKLEMFQKDFEYYIPVLIAHIKTLEDKIARKQSRLLSISMGAGVVFSLGSAFYGYAAYYFLGKDKAVQNFLDRPFDEWFFRYLPSICFAVVSAIFAAQAGEKFYKVFRYAERLVERLERDKKLLTILEQEKIVLDTKNRQKQYS